MATYPMLVRQIASSGSRRFIHHNSGRPDKISEVYIVSCARTPLGSFQGSLKQIPATKLGALAIKSCVEKLSLQPDSVEEVIMGCVVQAGVGQAPARQAALGAGLPTSTPCTTVNKVCASGMKAIMLGATSLALGLKDVIVAGGMESLSNTPFYLKRGATPYGGMALIDGCNHDALTDAYTNWHMGDCAENMVKKMGISREDQDQYAKLSYERWANANENNVFSDEIILMDQLSKDEEATAHDLENLLRLPTRWGDTVSPGSSAKLADGAAACVLMNENGLKRYKIQKPIARIVGFEDAALDPVDWPIAPAVGIKALLSRFGLDAAKDIHQWEINEAFAMVVIANLRILGLSENYKNVNIHGGAIAIGHPFGMSGARITNHLATSSLTTPGQLGVASLCNGGGGSSSILLEKL